MAINALARQTLLASIAALFSIGDHAVGLAAKAYEDWNLFDFNPEVQLEKKGFGANAKTPLTNEGAYPWREDTLDLWPAIQSYVKDFLQVYYKGDDNIVKADTELQKWRLEVLALHPGKEFPPIETQDQLAEVLSIIIWIASAGHASVNFNQVWNTTSLCALTLSPRLCSSRRMASSRTTLRSSACRSRKRCRAKSRPKPSSTRFPTCRHAPSCVH